MYLKIIVLVAKICLKMDGTWQLLGFSHFCLFKEFHKVMGLIPFRWQIVSKKKSYFYLFVTLLKLNTKTWRFFKNEI
jgi:hypothetical protein